MDDLEPCYRALDLEPGASLEEINRAWRDLTKVWHPDRFQGDPRMETKAEKKLQAVNDAYARLRAALATTPQSDVAEVAVSPAGADRSQPQEPDTPRAPRSRIARNSGTPRPVLGRAAVRIAPEWGFAASVLAAVVGILLLTGLANPRWTLAWQLVGVGALFFYLVCVHRIQAAVQRSGLEGSWTQPWLAVVLHLVPLINGYWMFVGWPRELARASPRLAAFRLGGLLFLTLVGTGLLTQGIVEAMAQGSIPTRVALACLTLSVAVLFFVPFALLSDARKALTVEPIKRGEVTSVLVPLGIAATFLLWAVVLWVDVRFDAVKRAAALNRLKQFSAAETLLRRRLTTNPSDGIAHVELATSLVGLGQKAEAVQSYRDAIRLKPDLVAGYRGLARLLSGDNATLEESITLFRKALNLSPADTAATVGLGFALRALSEQYQRLQIQEDARTGRQPSDMDPCLDLILKGHECEESRTPLQQQADAAKAESCNLFRQAVAQDVKGAWARFGVGLCYWDNKSSYSNGTEALASAEKEFQQAIDIDPTMSVAKSYLGEAIVWRNSTEAGATRRPTNLARVEEGLALMRRAVDMDKKNPQVWFELWTTLQAIGRTDEWLAVWREGFKQGVMTDPDAPRS